MKKLTLALLLPLLSTGAMIAPAKAADPSAIVPYLEIKLKTGGDDSRSGSVNYGQIRLRDGRTLAEQNLNRGTVLGNNSTRIFRIPAGVQLGDLQSFTLKHDGAPRNVFDSYDNWNLDAITITTPEVCTGGIKLSTPSIPPSVRLTGQKTFTDLKLTVDRAAMNRRPAYMQMRVQTGGDDLRGGSVAYATIYLRNGITLPTVNLNRGANWGNRSTSAPLNLPLNGNRLGDIAFIRLSYDGAPRNIFDSYDNWNIDRVYFNVPPSCSPGVTLTSSVGRPLVRFTGGKTFQSFTLRPR